MIKFPANLTLAAITSLFRKTEKDVGVVKTATVAHYDIRNYQMLCRFHQAEPDALVTLMVRFVYHVSAMVSKFNGATVNKNDDGVTASWNTPFSEENHVIQSVNSSLELVNKLHDINAELKTDGLPLITFGIGISSGDITLSNKAGYICAGPALDFSKFLSLKTNIYKVSIIINAEITNMLSNDYITIELDKLIYEDEPITIYTIIGLNKLIPVQHQIISYNHHNKFLRAYREQKWDIAISIANGLRNAWNSKLKDYYLTMIENCKHMKDNPPNEKWNDLYK